MSGDADHPVRTFVPRVRIGAVEPASSDRGWAPSAADEVQASLRPRGSRGKTPYERSRPEPRSRGVVRSASSG
jgi:hypothetical protein